MKICIFSAQSIGGTFLDWSLHFLSGQTEYYSSRENRFIPLVTNPLNQTIGNAHGHLKNHPTGYKNTKLYLETCNQDCLYSMYATTQMIRHINRPDSLSKDNFKLYQQDQIEDTVQLCKLLAECNIPTIHLAGESNIPLYFTNARSIDIYMFNEGRPTSESDLDNERNEFFFKDSLDQWNAAGLDKIWDIREKNALNLRPMDLKTEYYLPGPHLRIDCREFWHNGIDVIHRVMSYLNLDIVQDRLNTWKEIYNNWSQQHIRNMSFVYNCDHIVSAVVNNWDYTIDLTFNQEVVVLHFLMYKYHLNLKSWNLDKFPDNTQKLHQLLEPNIHQVADIYNE